MTTVNDLFFNAETIKNYSITTDKQSKSIAWQHFGRLQYNGKTISNDRNFCNLCLDVAKKSAEAETEQASSSTSNKNTKTKKSNKTNKKHASNANVKKTSFMIKSYHMHTSSGNLNHHLEEVHQITIDKQHTTSQNAFHYDIRSFLKPGALSTIVKQKNKKLSRAQRKKKFILGRELALWFCRDLLPFAIAEGDGFLIFLNNQGLSLSREDVPVATTIMREALSDIFRILKDELRRKIKAEAGAITFDTWTDNYRHRSYITFTYHEIVNFQLKHYTLTTKLVSGAHTGEHIRDEMVSIIDLFQIKAKKIFAVTDAGANVVKAARLAGMEHHKCLGHGLHNLIMVDGIKSIPELDNLISLMRQTVGALRYKAESLEKVQAEQMNKECNAAALDQTIFEEEEYEEVFSLQFCDWENESGSCIDDELENPDDFSNQPTNQTNTLKTDSKTRWHSLLIMLESLKKSKAAVVQLLSETDSEIHIQKKDWNLVDELINVLSDFKKTVEILSQDQRCTMNYALLLRSHLKTLISSLSKTESSCIQQMKKNMLSNFEKRFPLTDLVVLGSLLDPTFKHLDAIDEHLKKYDSDSPNEGKMTREKFLVKKIIDYKLIPEPNKEVSQPAMPSSKNVSTSERAKKSNSNTEFIKNLVKQYSRGNASSSIQHEVELECESYVKLATQSDGISDVLDFWKKHESTYPQLSKLAAAVLCVPATSTPSERVFSVSGAVVDKKRANIHPNNVNKVVFVHDNYKIAVDACSESYKKYEEVVENSDSENSNSAAEDDVDPIDVD